MLRSAKRIEIKVKTFQNYDGFMLAPIIDLNGLILSAEQTIDPKIKEFIESKGGKIGRVRMEDELLVRLTGEFNITRQEVTDFIKEFTAAGGKLPSINEDMPRLPNFSKIIEDDMQAEEAKGPALTFSNQACQISVRRNFNQIGKSLTCTVGHSLRSDCAASFVGTDISYSGREAEFGGLELEGFKDAVPLVANLDGVQTATPLESGISEVTGISVGYMGAMYAQQKISFDFKRYISLQDNVLSSKDVISIGGGENLNLSLGIDKSVEWLNIPSYPEQYNDGLKHTPGKVKVSPG